MINIIVATSKNNQMPWHIPEDLKYFKEKTKGHMVVMGRKTYESIGHPLPNRKNIVLTRNTTFKPEGVTVLHSFEQALIMCSAEDESYIIGGGEIYDLFLPFANRLYITIVDKDIEGDTEFCDYSDDFKLMERFKGTALTSDNYPFEFTVWDRK